MNNIESEIKKLLSKEQTAALLNISLPTLNRLVLAKKIKAIKIGHAVRFERQAIEAYLNNSSTAQINQ